MSGNGNSPAKFPAGRALVSFGAGCCVTGACMAGLAALMAQQGLSQDAAWPMATCAVSAGSLFSGWLMAFWQKSRGLLCGVVQGALFAFPENRVHRFGAPAFIFQRRDSPYVGLSGT